MAHCRARPHGRAHRQPGCDQPPRVPGAARTDLHVGGITGVDMAPCVCEDAHEVVTRRHQGVTGRVVAVRRGTVPGAAQPPWGQDKTQLATHNPPMMALPLLSHLLGAPSCAPRVEQLDALGVRPAPHGGSSQKPGRPRRVRLAEAGHTGALRHVGQQRQGVARQPAIAGAGPAPVDGLQPGQRHNCTERQFGLRVLWHLQPLVVYRVKPGDQQIWGSHMAGSLRLKFAQPQLEPVWGYLSTRTLDVTDQTNTIG
jgi:hypothetical protein